MPSLRVCAFDFPPTGNADVVVAGFDIGRKDFPEFPFECCMSRLLHLPFIVSPKLKLPPVGESAALVGQLVWRIAPGQLA